MALRRERRSYLFSGETFSVDLIAALSYVGRLREIGEITRPIVVNVSLGTNRPTASLESAIDFAISQGVIIVASAGNRGPDGMGWPGAFPQVISAGAIGSTRNGPSRLGVGSSRMSSRECRRELCREFQFPGDSGQQLDLVAPGVAVFCPGAASLQAFRALSARGYFRLGRACFAAFWGKLSPRKPARTVTGLRCTFAVDPALWSIPGASASATTRQESPKWLAQSWTGSSKAKPVEDVRTVW